MNFTYMLVEVALVCKRGSAARHLAFIGLFSSMKPVVGFQDAFLIERTATAREWTFKVALTQVCLLRAVVPVPCGKRRPRLTEHVNVSMLLLSRGKQTRNHSVVHAGVACAMKRLTGAVSAEALCAMIALGLAMKQEGLYACNPVHSGKHPSFQVL